jgi:hypothetical protein
MTRRPLNWKFYAATAAAGAAIALTLLLLKAPPLVVGLGILAGALLTDAITTLLERLRWKKADTGKAPALLRTPRLLELAAAEANLRSLRAAYKAGRTSGHPEDALWDIEDAERRVARLRAGTD